MADGRFFSTTKKGEVAEYKNDLHSLDRKSQKNAVKRVIAAMTVGKDVSSLFPDVVNCMQTEDMELKKLVYLYLINYAKTQPDLAIMAVNTFVKDTQDPNPLIRALAVRTMGCIRVDKITEYLCDPLQRCLKDEDPYVRKTAAVCVAKLYDISAEMVEDRGFLDVLRDMVGDANPMVVANAVAALAEIQASSSGPVFVIDGAVLTKLLRALNECSEWGQVFILDALAAYTPADSRDAEGIVERVAARLQHANGAVVLSAIKLILHAAKYIDDAGARAAIHKKLAPPLVTLLGAEPEIQYVALRNIDLIVQSVPGILSHEVKVFFCKYNDPIYVKTEKLEIMIKLADEKNIDQMLLELREYASEVDVDFVRKAVRAVGRCAISLEPAAERCVNVLLDLIQGRVSYVVQEAVVVLRDVFRRYPGRYERVIAPLCECLEALDEPEAKAAMVWIIGEYADRIDNADELLEQFLEGFPEESPGVQLALVTATVKLFLRKPSEKPQALIQLVLSYATQETDSPDLRDRAYIYWRLLSADPDAARDVVLAPRPVIEAAADGVDPALRAELLGELGSLASVLHRPAAAFTSAARLAVRRARPGPPRRLAGPGGRRRRRRHAGAGTGADHSRRRRGARRPRSAGRAQREQRRGLRRGRRPRGAWRRQPPPGPPCGRGRQGPGHPRWGRARGRRPAGLPAAPGECGGGRPPGRLHDPAEQEWLGPGAPVPDHSGSSTRARRIGLRAGSPGPEPSVGHARPDPGAAGGHQGVPAGRALPGRCRAAGRATARGRAHQPRGLCRRVAGAAGRRGAGADAAPGHPRRARRAGQPGGRQALRHGAQVGARRGGTVRDGRGGAALRPARAAAAGAAVRPRAARRRHGVQGPGDEPGPGRL
ncbi:AP1B1 [Auxenochlorella protothecoides x Auxenochlorella symbiontica]